MSLKNGSSLPRNKMRKYCISLLLFFKWLSKNAQFFHYKDNYLLSLGKFFCRLNHNCLTLILSSLFVDFGQLFLGLSYLFLNLGQLFKFFAIRLSGYGNSLNAWVSHLVSI